MNKNLSRKSLSGQGGIHFKVGRNKPYWNAELKKILNDKRQTERDFLKCKDPAIRKQLKDHYKQTKFDKRVRFYKRQFRIGQALQLDHCKVTIHNNFGKK